jgi:ATP-binding cassette subfamily B multidrug efflux pump
MRGGRIEKARDPRGAAGRLLAYMIPHRWTLAGIFILVVIGTLLDLAGPALMGMAIDRFISAGDLGGLLRLAVLMLAVYALSWLAQLAQGVVMAATAQKAMRVLRRDLFEHLQTLSLSFFDRHPHGELMSRLTNDLTAISQVLSQNVTQLFAGLLSLAGIIAAMFAVNYRLALASMLVLPMMMGLVGFVGRRTRSGFREYQKRIGQLNGTLEEMFSGQRVIIAFGREAAMLGEFDAANGIVRAVGTKAQTYSLLIPPLMGILSNANIAVVAGLGGWMALQGLASVGVIAAFYTYSRNFARPLRQLGDIYNQIQTALAGTERVFEIIDTEPEIADEPDAAGLEKVDGQVVFDHVDFAYEAGVPVLKDVGLRAEQGRTVALVGPTGAGKTTIVNLLMRFYDIPSGSIRIDGRDIRAVRKADLRRQVGVVLQDTFLFSDTVMENIRYGRLSSSDEDCIAAAKLANADQFIRRLPMGYRTELSERGSNLSQGQRQLLAIARTILADPRILVLDEATSSVDTRTEANIQRALLRLMEGRTSFVIAHRLSTIRNADRLLVIDGGRIIERGTHDSLLAQKGFYYNLYMSQFKGRKA